MSSILKALKKVENDKATRRPDELRIGAEILRSNAPARLSTAGVLITSVLLMACGSGATLLYMKRDKMPDVVNRQSAALPKQKAPVASSTSDLNTEQLPAVVVLPVRQQETVLIEHPGVNQATAPSGSVATILTAKPVKTVVAAKPTALVKASISTSTSSTAPAKGVPVLRVNGIAFQNGVGENVAIVNGITVSKGSVIEGATVEEVQKDRVMFQHNGEKYAVELGQSNR